MARVAVKSDETAGVDAGPISSPKAEVLSIRRLPRITVHAYCASRAVAEMLERAARDRRMSRAHLVLQPGGAAAAVTAYAEAPTPDLIILENAADEDLLGRLDELASVCDLGTKVLVIGSRNDVRFYRELMKRGVSEYVQAPVTDMEVISVIAGIYAERDSEKFGRTCAFIGARGGAGSSTVAQNVAWTIGERHGAEVILADLDLAFGTAALNYDLEPAHGIAEAIRETERLDEIMLDRLLTKAGERLNILSSPALLDNDYDFGPTGFEKLLDLAQSAAPYTILDMPHVWTGWSRRTLIAADEVVITATPDLASLRNAKHMIDLLREARPNDAPPKLVLNQLNAPKRPEIKPSEFASVLQLEPIALIPFEPKLFGQAAINGQMIAAGRNGVAKSMAELAAAITGRRSGSARQTGLRRLARMLSFARRGG